MIWVFVAIGLIGLGGWIANIVKLCGMNFDHFSGWMMARGIGIFVAPLGAVLGFF